MVQLLLQGHLIVDMIDLLGLYDSVLREYFDRTNLGVIISCISLALSILDCTLKGSGCLERCRLIARRTTLESASLDNLAKSDLAKGTLKYEIHQAYLHQASRGIRF